VQSGKGYDLNRSLFERLIQEGITYKALSQQHRMRPEIAAPVRKLMYPHLTDAPTTSARPYLRGTRSRSVMLLSHTWPERADTDAGVASMDSASRINGREAEYVVAVLKYVLQQGYSAGEVVVLTPYLGQLRLIRAKMRNSGIADVLDERDEDNLEAAGLAEDAVRLLAYSDNADSLAIDGRVSAHPEGLPFFKLSDGLHLFIS
jgi:hypothetical protein